MTDTQTKPVLLVRATGNEADASALAELGIASVTEPYLEIRTVPGAEGYQAATDLLAKMTALANGDWVIVTSVNGLKHWGILYGQANLATALSAAQDRGVKFAAIGETSAAMYSTLGIHPVLIASAPYGGILAQEVLAATDGLPHRALIPTGNLAMAQLRETLLQAGWGVDSVVVYQTSSVVDRPTSASALVTGDFSLVILRSPSAARALLQHGGVSTVPVICGGNTTADAARDLGLRVVAVAEATDPASMAQTVQRVLFDLNRGVA